MRASTIIRLRRRWIPRQKKFKIAGIAKGPNATEARYLRDVINPSLNGGKHIVEYEPKPIIITETTQREYTADFLVSDASGSTTMKPTYHEVKGSYRLPTQDRARLAWEIAAERNPQFDFVWATLTRTGWEIERWTDGGKKIAIHLPNMPRGTYIEVGPNWRRHKPKKCSTWKKKSI